MMDHTDLPRAAALPIVTEVAVLHAISELALETTCSSGALRVVLPILRVALSSDNLRCRLSGY